MHQAQGALDAARAAGAGRFAADEFAAASAALARAQDAVGAGDYRQALSLALDSRERARNAARLAVESRANARGQAERAIAEVATVLSHVQDRLRRPEVTRLPRRTLRSPRDTVAAADTALQKARAALAQEDYAEVPRALGSTMAELQATLRQLDAALAPAPARRPR